MSEKSRMSFKQVSLGEVSRELDEFAMEEIAEHVQLVSEWKPVYDGVFEQDINDDDVITAINSTMQWKSDRITVRLVCGANGEWIVKA